MADPYGCVGESPRACDSQDMDPVGLVLLLIAIGIVVGLAAVTAIGQRRRGARPATVLLAGLFFPLAWIGWYTRDELQKGQSPS